MNTEFGANTIRRSCKIAWNP